MTWRRHGIVWGLTLGLALACINGCQRDEPLQVKLNERTVLDGGTATEMQKPLTVCVGSMITPQAGYGYYRQMIDYLSARVGRKIDPIDPRPIASSRAARPISPLSAAALTSAAMTASASNFWRRRWSGGKPSTTPT